MVRWTDSGDTRRGPAQRAAYAKTNFAAEFAALEARAIAVKAGTYRNERQRERQLEQLRREYQSLQRLQQYVKTGVSLNF